MADLISVRDVRELKAVVIAFSRLPAEIKRQINEATRTEANPIWQDEVASRLRSPMDRKVLGAGVQVKAGNPVVMRAATSTRAIGGRLRPASDYPGWEFGANRNKVTTYKRKSKRGGTHKVTRHTARQMPARNRKGRAIYPAFTAAAPRLGSLWVQTVVRCIQEAAEGKSS